MTPTHAIVPIEATERMVQAHGIYCDEMWPDGSPSGEQFETMIAASPSAGKVSREQFDQIVGGLLLPTDIAEYLAVYVISALGLEIEE